VANRTPSSSDVVGDVTAAVVEGDASHEAADAAGATEFVGERGGGEEDVAGVHRETPTEKAVERKETALTIIR